METELGTVSCGVSGKTKLKARYKDETETENTTSPVNGDEEQAQADGNKTKGLDANRYATKKTIAQGMLDVALLTANASQLKYILQVGQRHEFYYLMLTLISTSMVLQVLNGIIMVVLSTSYNINKTKHHLVATVLNDIVLSAVVVITTLNVVIGVFDMRSAADYPSGATTTEAAVKALALQGVAADYLYDLQTS